MTKSLNIAFAAALVTASLAGASTAFAGGDGEYYKGVSSAHMDRMRMGEMGAPTIDPAGTASVSGDGEYYAGATAPAAGTM